MSPVRRIEHGARGGLELSDIDTRSERGDAGFEAVLTASAYRNVLDRIPGAEYDGRPWRSSATRRPSPAR